MLYVLYENEEGWKYLRQALELAVFDDDPRYLLFLADGYHQRNEKTGVFGQSNFGFPAVRCLDSQDVDPAVALDGCRDHSFDLFVLSEVGRHCDGVAARRDNPVHGVVDRARNR